MSRIYVRAAVLVAPVLAFAAFSFGQAADQKADRSQEDRLIAVLKSDAPRQEKADACLTLAHVGTKESVPVLAGMLEDEKLSHMARFALETIPDASADEALRKALGKVKGRQLVGVIGSIGVRRDVKAVDALVKLLKDKDPDVARQAAQSLGGIGTAYASAVLLQHLQASSPMSAPRIALCEGLFRCAERLAGPDDRDPIASSQMRRSSCIAAYDYLRKMKDAPHQACTGAVRGAILARGKDGLALLQEYLSEKDYLLFAAACRTSLEMPGTDVTGALNDALKQVRGANRILLIQTLGWRKDKTAVPALSASANKGAKAVRLTAILALAEIQDASAVPALEGLVKDSDPELSKAAKESLASYQPLPPVQPSAQTQPAPRS